MEDSGDDFDSDASKVGDDRTGGGEMTNLPLDGLGDTDVVSNGPNAFTVGYGELVLCRINDILGDSVEVGRMAVGVTVGWTHSESIGANEGEEMAPVLTVAKKAVEVIVGLTSIGNASGSLKE